MALQIRRGVEADRTSFTPASGEPLFVIDTQKVYIGDGSTAGGVEVGGGGGGGGGFTPVRQVYLSTTSGITIPSGATLLHIIARGAGGGGAGGAVGNSGAARCGGGGGGPGNCSMHTKVRAADITDGTISVVIGAGGSGGLGAQTVDGTVGNGSTGGQTYVQATFKGTANSKLTMAGNGYGGYGSATGVSASGATNYGVGYPGTGGGTSRNNGNATGATFASNDAGLSMVSTGGGAGAGFSGSTEYNAGSTGPLFTRGLATNFGGSGSGGPGADGSSVADQTTDMDFGFYGGSGGGANSSGDGGPGGNGYYGAGGGGGGAGRDLGIGAFGGNGGSGGDGMVIFYWS